MTDPFQVYEQRHSSFLQDVAGNLKEHVSSHFHEMKNIDQITARAKDPDSFATKGQQLDENGHRKYKSPLTEIQDQLGVRIVVFFKQDVRGASETMHRYFHAIEDVELVPDSFWEFGYFGLHQVLALPEDVIPPEVDVTEVPRFFELQIKTLFQHAWSQANHDLGYKAPNDLSGDQERRLAFTSAQAWGADRIFDELRAELAKTAFPAADS